jgi:hypothetical protein
MLSSALAAVLGPFASLSNKHAISSVYKTLEITPTLIRGTTPWGILEVNCESGVADSFLIDSARFIAVVQSLPNAELELAVANNALTWKCGYANGKLAVAPPIESTKPDWPEWEKLWSPDKQFLECLEIGGLSCGPQSMASAGVYGIAFDRTDEGLMLSSSDSVTMAICKAHTEQLRSSFWPHKFVLVPDALDLLTTILKQGTPRFGVDSQAVWASAGDFRLMLRPAPLLKQDILALASNFASKEAVATIPADRIGAFIKRAGALAESKANTMLTLRVVAGAIELSFAEGAATSDEYYLVDSLDVPGGLPEIKLDATRLARVLSYTDKVAFDHIDRGVLVFFGLKPAFDYLICGAEG